MNPLFGIRVHTNINLTVPVRDWSGVRSKSRARRRAKRGFRQNVKTLYLPDPNIYQTPMGYIMHPETLKKMEAAFAMTSGGSGYAFGIKP